MQTVKIIIEDGRIEQFNEEVMKEFERKINVNNYLTEGWKLAQPNDSLLCPDEYPESRFEMSEFRIKDFITQKLAEHKELILKMVREKAKIRIKEELNKYIGHLSHEEISKIISAKL